jgi:hypothetical protein
LFCPQRVKCFGRRVQYGTRCVVDYVPRSEVNWFTGFLEGLDKILFSCSTTRRLGLENGVVANDRADRYREVALRQANSTRTYNARTVDVAPVASVRASASRCLKGTPLSRASRAPESARRVRAAKRYPGACGSLWH